MKCPRCNHEFYDIIPPQTPVFARRRIDNYDAVSDEIDKVLAKKGLDKGPAIYSACGEKEENLYYNNLREIAVEGKVRVLYDSDWGGRSQGKYLSRVLKNPTWMKLYEHAHKAVSHTGDYHHVYFEGFQVIKIDGDVKIVELSMGS